MRYIAILGFLVFVVPPFSYAEDSESGRVSISEKYCGCGEKCAFAENEKCDLSCCRKALQVDIKKQIDEKMRAMKVLSGEGGAKSVKPREMSPNMADE